MKMMNFRNSRYDGCSRFENRDVNSSLISSNPPFKSLIHYSAKIKVLFVLHIIEVPTVQIIPQKKIRQRDNFPATYSFRPASKWI